jgi:hypothetical protein
MLDIAKKIGKIYMPYLVVSTLWLLFCIPYFFKGLVPVPSTYLVTFFAPWNTSYAMPVKNGAMPDIFTQIMPWKMFTISEWKAGRIPLWNPYSFSGTPHAANFQSAVFSPFTPLFFLLPFIDAWSIMIVLQPLLAGLGIVFFLRQTKHTDLACALAGIGYMFSGAVVTWMGYGTLAMTIAMFPWLFGGLTRMALGKNFGTSLIVFSVLTAFLSGHFQMGLYVVGAGILYVFWLGLVEKKVSLRTFLRMMGAIVAGLCIAAPQFILTYGAFVASTRTASSGMREVIPWPYLATLISPDIFGNPVTRNDWYGHYAEWASYIGVIPLLFSLYGIGSLKLKRPDSKFFFVILGLLGLLLSFDTPLVTLMFALKIPVLSTSAASRIIVMLSFALSVLAAYGIDAWIEDVKKHAHASVLKKLAIPLLVMGVITMVPFLFHIIPAEKISISIRNLALPLGTLGLASVMLYVATRMKQAKVILAVGVMLVILGSFDSYRFATKWMPFESRAYVYPTTPLLTFLQTLPGNDRVFGNIGGEVGVPFHQPLIEGYDAMYPGRYGEFIQSLKTGTVMTGERSVVMVDKNGKYTEHALRLLGVRYIVNKVSDKDTPWTFPVWRYAPDVMKKIYGDATWEVYEYTHALPRVSLIYSYTTEKPNQQIINTLFDPSFDMTKKIVLEKEPFVPPAVGTGSATISTYTPTAITLRTESSTNALLFLSDPWDSGWHAAIDGTPTEILRADYDFRAVALPKGTHTVTMTYWPDGLTVGFLLSGLGMCLGIFIRQISNAGETVTSKK